MTVLGTNDSHSCVLTTRPVFPEHFYFQFWIKMCRIYALVPFSISSIYFSGNIHRAHFSCNNSINNCISVNKCKIFAQRVVNKESSGISSYYFDLRFVVFPVIEIQSSSEFTRVCLGLYLCKCEQNLFLLEGSEMLLIPVIF